MFAIEILHDILELPGFALPGLELPGLICKFNTKSLSHRSVSSLSVHESRSIYLRNVAVMSITIGDREYQNK